MKCQKCDKDFQEKELDRSHDVPKYIGGNDLDGSHYLCKKCHDIYERLVMWKMTLILPDDIKEKMRREARLFANSHFKGK